MRNFFQSNSWGKSNIQYEHFEQIYRFCGVHYNALMYSIRQEAWIAFSLCIVLNTKRHNNSKFVARYQLAKPWGKTPMHVRGGIYQ